MPGRWILFTTFFFLAGLFLPPVISAQGFGSNPDNYSCPVYRLGGVSVGPIVEGDTRANLASFFDPFVCKYWDASFDINGNGRAELSEIIERQAIPEPPTLTIVQVWFVRLLYIVWGISGVVFAFILIGLGFKYMTSFGNEVAVGDVIKGFQRWLVGLALIFLSYPLLATFFALLPISNSTCYSDIEMPGFQFFFPEACQVSCVELCNDAYANGGNSTQFISCIRNCPTP